MKKEIDMTPYEKYFTELERLYFEKNAHMNIVAYMADNLFNEDAYNKIFNDYTKSLRAYEMFIPIFEKKVVIPACNGPVSWRADFELRVIYVD